MRATRMMPPEPGCRIRVRIPTHSPIREALGDNDERQDEGVLLLLAPDRLGVSHRGCRSTTLHPLSLPGGHRPESLEREDPASPVL